MVAHPHTEYDSAIKERTADGAAAWMILNDILLSGRSQTQRGACGSSPSTPKSRKGSLSSKLMESRSVTAWGHGAGKRHKRLFGGDWNGLYLTVTVVIDAYACQNSSNCTPKRGSFYVIIQWYFSRWFFSINWLNLARSFHAQTLQCSHDYVTMLMPTAAESSYTPWKWNIFNTKNVLWLFLSLNNLLQELTAPFFPFTWISLNFWLNQ